jgi:hypothetical protein
MAAQTTDDLIDEVNDHAYAGHANCSRTVLLAKPRWWARNRRPAAEREHMQTRERAHRPGMRLIGTGAVLLILLGVGLLAVSYAAQYRYVLGERGQVTASLIEAGALDVGMIIFSLIALGLALAGLASKTERVLIIACAVASAVMNFALADSSNWRSVLAWTMPPVFLAVVVDRVVSAARRHALGVRDGASPWVVAAAAVGKVLRFGALAALYGLRFVLAPPSTAAGARRAVLAATPLPQAGERPAIEAPQVQSPAPPPATCHRCGATPAWGTVHVCPNPPARRGRTGTKTALLIERVTERYGLLTAIEPDQVSQIANIMAPEVDLHPASARTALLKAVRAAHVESDDK